ncbi:hypothetical protein BV898_18743 [Hypsibius exemplaris]|uniref:Uncharacterized protein n=1 Tax=Hypsibius exemplaris TaxID=2072580 RepID=A0A9X6RNS1_HYPEX|nr:hypothetical protein BV898_18743 [Hypsibius exemplaris]
MAWSIPSVGITHFKHSPDLALQDLAAEAQYLTPGLFGWENVQNKADIGIQIANWIAIFTIDCCLLTVLHRHLETRKTLFHAPERAPAVSRSSQSSGSALRLVIACSALYVFTMALPITSNILLIANEPLHCSYYSTTKTLDLLSGLGTMSLLVNYSAGIFLYCLTWKRFRERIKSWVRLWFPTAARRERRSSSEMTVMEDVSRSSVIDETMRTMPQVNIMRIMAKWTFTATGRLIMKSFKP